MKKYLCFDTETTGMVNFKAGPSSFEQPDLIQVALIQYTEDEIINKASFLVKENEKIIHDRAFLTHGISQEKVDEFGIPRRNALALIHNMVQSSDCLVAHNFKFDSLILKTLYYRQEVNYNILEEKEHCCTMMSTIDILKIPGKYGNYKFPSLDEVYRHFVDKNGFSGAHDALVDTEACMKVHLELLKGGYVK